MAAPGRMNSDNEMEQAYPVQEKSSMEHQDKDESSSLADGFAAMAMVSTSSAASSSAGGYFYIFIIEIV